MNNTGKFCTNQSLVSKILFAQPNRNLEVLPHSTSVGGVVLFDISIIVNGINLKSVVGTQLTNPTIRIKSIRLSFDKNTIRFIFQFWVSSFLFLHVHYSSTLLDTSILLNNIFRTKLIVTVFYNLKLLKTWRKINVGILRKLTVNLLHRHQNEK